MDQVTLELAVALLAVRAVQAAAATQIRVALRPGELVHSHHNPVILVHLVLASQAVTDNLAQDFQTGLVVAAVEQEPQAAEPQDLTVATVA